MHDTAVTSQSTSWEAVWSLDSCLFLWTPRGLLSLRPFSFKRPASCQHDSERVKTRTFWAGPDRIASLEPVVHNQLESQHALVLGPPKRGYAGSKVAMV